MNRDTVRNETGRGKRMRNDATIREHKKNKIRRNKQGKQQCSSSNQSGKQLSKEKKTEKKRKRSL